MSEDDIYKKMIELEERLEEVVSDKEDLQEKVASLEEENTTLKRNLERVRQNQQEQEKHLSDLDDVIEEWDDFKTIVNSRLDAVASRLEDIEKTVHENRKHSEERRAEISKRITVIQNALDIDSDEFQTDLIEGDAPTLEQVSQLPKEMRENNPNIDRAATIWEYFDRFATYTPKGYIVRSTDVKNLLTTTREQEFHWNQVHRAMEAFNENTPAEYSYIETNSGKALIQYHDSTEARVEEVDEN
jgi:DNA repair exonuclease SbcCD ATPase subunit